MAEDIKIDGDKVVITNTNTRTVPKEQYKAQLQRQLDLAKKRQAALSDGVDKTVTDLQAKLDAVK